MPCGFSAPDLVYAGILGFDTAMAFAVVSYAQPATNQVPLTGWCNDATDWYAEAFYQHHATTYMTLLGGQSVIPPQAPVTQHPSSRSHLRQKLGPIASLPKPATR